MIESSELAATAGRWTYSCCYCNVTIGQRDWTLYGYQCAVCGNKNLRFIHVLEHPDNQKRRIQVGIECAQTLLVPEHIEAPRRAEAETARKERWRRRYQNYGLCKTTIEDLEAQGKL